MKRKIISLLLCLLVLTLAFASCDKLGKKVESIAVVEGTLATELEVGDTLNTDGLKITVTYSDGSTEEVGKDKLEIGTLDTATAGEKELTITYEGVSVTVTVTVKEKASQEVTLTGIKIVSGSYPSSVNVGATYEAPDLQVEALYSDGSKKPVKASDLEIILPSTTASGDAELTVKYGGFTDKVTVKVNGATRITVVAGTLASEIFVGGNFDTSRLQVTVTLSDGTQVIVPGPELTLGTIDTTKIGDQKLSISYLGYTYEHTVKVIGVTGIKVNAGSVATSVKVFGTLDISNVTAKAIYSNGIERPLASAELTVEPFDTTTAGEKELVVKYGDLVDKVTVNVIGVKSISVVRGTLVSEILKGEAIDISALKINVTFTDNTTDVVSVEKLNVTVPSTNEAGEKNVEIKYLDGTYNAKVNVYYLASIKVTEGSVATSVKVFGTLDTSKVTAKAIYSNGTEKPLTTAELTVGAVDLTTAGEKELVVAYGALTDKVTVTVIGVKTLTIAEGTLAGEVLVDGVLDLSKVRATVEFTDGTTDVLEANELTLGAFSTAEAGDKKLTVTYLDKTVEADVKVCGVASIRVENAPLSFTAGEKPDFSKIKVYAVYSDTNKTEVLLTKDYTTNVDSIEINTEGDKTVTVTYNGELGNFTADVIVSTTPPVVTSISFDKITTIFKIGENTNIASLVTIKVTYSNGATVNKTNADEGVTVSEVSTAVAGSYPLTATYTEGGVTKTATATVKVLPVASFTVTGMPTLVNKGEALDTSKVKIEVTYSDGTNTVKEILTEGFTVSTLDTTAGGDKTVTVSFGGKTVDCNVHVKALSKIEIVSRLPEYVLYGHAITLSGDITVKLTYTNGTVEKTKTDLGDALTVTYGNTNVAEKYAKVSVSYTENGQTVTDEKDVEILPITEIKVNGMPTMINKGETLDLTGVTVTVVYSNGTVTENDVIDITDATVNALDTTTGGDKSVTVTYSGKEAVCPIHVKAVSGITFLAGSFPEPVRNKYTVDTSSVTVEISYTDGSKVQKKYVELGNALTLTGLNVDVATNVYTATVTAAYEGFTATATVTVLQIAYKSENVDGVAQSVPNISALNGTVPSSVALNATLPLDQIKLTVVYTDGNGNEYTYLIPTTDPNLTLSSIDTSSVGEKALIFDYLGLKTSIRIIVKGIQQISIVDGTVQTTIKKGQEFDTSELKIMVQYTDGTYIYVDTTNVYLSLSDNVNINTAGDYKLTATYQGVSCELKITVKDISTGSGVSTIFGTSLPSNLTARESYKNNFKDSTQIYVVGDDNPYIFRLTLLMLDENYELVDTSAGYTSVSKVYLVENGTETEVGAEYVGINELTNAFDFTEAAVGKTFKIVSAPAEAPTMTQSQTVKVVNAYNIYSAKELNIVNNYDYDLNGSEGEGWISKLNAANKLLSENGITRPDNLRGIVFHGNINIKPEDLPQEYYYTYKGKDGTTKTELLDCNSMYYWFVTPENPTFDIYGNYYSLYSYNLPCVIEGGVLNNTDNFSNSELFKFSPNHSLVYNHPDFVIDPYSANVQNLAMRDNDPNSNDQSASDRHMRGLIAFKPMMLNFNVTNTNIDAYYLSLCTDGDNTAVNLNKVKFYNAWQGHLFLWNRNLVSYWNDLDNSAPLPTHQRGKITITDSLVAKCGGPVILSQTPDIGYASQSDSGTDVIVDDKSEMYSYVTGQEAWFVAVGQTGMAGQILAMNQLISGTAAAQGITAGYTSSDKIQGVSTMNLIMVVMGAGLTIGGNDDYDGSFTKGGVTALQMNDGMNPVVDQFLSMTGGQAPVFQSSAGSGTTLGTCFSDGANGIFTGVNADGSYAFATKDSGCFDGDYITLYYLGMGVLLEYYN